MGFNPMTYARLAEKTIQKNNPIKTTINAVLYALLTFVNLPYKMKLLDFRIKEYQTRLDKLEKIINDHPEKEKSGNKFNTLR